MDAKHSVSCEEDVQQWQCQQIPTLCCCDVAQEFVCTCLAHAQEAAVLFEMLGGSTATHAREISLTWQ